MTKKEWLARSREPKVLNFFPDAAKFIDSREIPAVHQSSMIRQWRIRTEKLEKHGFKTYQCYLDSDHWKDIVKQHKVGHCQMCRSDESLVLHHCNYDSIFSEKASDLMTLCYNCHSSVHVLASSTYFYSLNPRNWPVRNHMAELEKVYKSGAKRRYRRPKPLPVLGNAEAKEMTLRKIRLDKCGLTYKQYITSSHWHTVVDEHKRDGCQMCARKSYLALHHTTYRNLGAETVADLMTVCSSCHTTIHVLAASTKEFSLDPRRWPAGQDPHSALQRVYELDARRRSFA